jgi:hypothetical protein
MNSAHAPSSKLLAALPKEAPQAPRLHAHIPPQTSPGRWFAVTLFAVAMAWVESAVVFYLRTMINRIEPYQPNPLPEFGGLAKAEVLRELATLMMLATVGWLAGRNWRSGAGYCLLAFGVWDIFYYVFLKVLTGWPRSLFDWDILFLIPLPWWGPVLAPMCIAALMVLWGTLVTQFGREDGSISSNKKAWLLNAAGVALALYVFMQDALRIAGEGTQALRSLLPIQFNWPLFAVALLLMAVPVLNLCRGLWDRRAPAFVVKS